MIVIFSVARLVWKIKCCAKAGIPDLPVIGGHVEPTRFGIRHILFTTLGTVALIEIALPILFTLMQRAGQ